MQKSGLRPVTAYCCHNSLGSLVAMPKGESATSPAPIRAKLAREPPLPAVLQLSSPGADHPLHGSCWGSSPDNPGFLHLPPPTHQVLFLSRGVLTCLLTPHPGPWHIAGNWYVLTGRQGQAITLVTQYDIHLVHAIEEQISE